MVDLSLFPTCSQLTAWIDETLDEALSPLQKHPMTTLDAIEEALKGKVDSWTYYPAWADGWCASEEDCAHLKAWEPIEVRIHARRAGSVSFRGVNLMVLFPRCTETGECSCGAACREVA